MEMRDYMTTALKIRLIFTVLCTIGAGTLLAAGQIATGQPDGLPGDAYQFGALGLCAWMVYRNYTFAAKKDAEIEKLTRSIIDLHDVTMKTIHRITDVLSTKKCVADDKTIQEIKDNGK